MGFGFTGLGTAAGAGQGLKNLITQRLEQAKFEQDAKVAADNARLAQQRIELGNEELAGRTEDRALLRQTREATLDRDQRENEQLLRMVEDPNPQLAQWAKMKLADRTGSFPSGLFDTTPGGSAGTDYRQGFARWLKDRNKDLSTATSAEEAQFKKEWEKLNDRPFAPVIIQTAGGPQAVDRNSRVARPITSEATGEQVGYNPSATERGAGEDAYVAMGVLDQLERSSFRAKTGPVASRVEGAKVAIPGLTPNQDYTDFDSQSSILLNTTIRAITGAAMSEREADRIRNQVPLSTDKPVVWNSKAKATRQNLKDIMESKSMGIPLETLLARRAGMSDGGGGTPGGGGRGGGTGTGGGSGDDFIRDPVTKKLRRRTPQDQ